MLRRRRNDAAAASFAVTRRLTFSLMRLSLLMLGGLLVTQGCAVALSPDEPMPPQIAATPLEMTPLPAAFRTPSPDVIAVANRKQNWTCVSYVKEYSSIDLRGDGWQWWRAAEGRYDRGTAPKVGAVLVLKRTKQMRSGHVAIVSSVLDNRTILVDHANWGWNRATRGKIHVGMKVIDVSKNNDWSQTRFWYEAGDTLGSRVYPANGFIYPPEPRAITRVSRRATTG